MKPSPGMHISFSYLGQSLEGVVVNEEQGRLVIKLQSGYNIVADSSDLKGVKEQKVPAKRKAERPEAAKAGAGLPKISLLHTGGTVASKVDYETGAVVAKYTADEILGLYPDLHKLADMSSRLIRNMMSDDMRFGHYNLMGEAVKEAIEGGAQGVILTQGTDTLHYTAAALGFMLENLPVPVVVVGSQRSSDRGSSDASTNLLAAVRFILGSKGGGVTVCMHGASGDDAFHIIDGFRARKMHTSRRDAFRSINRAPIAVVGKKVKASEPLQKPEGKLRLLPFNEKLKVGMLYIHPNMDVKEFEAYKDFDGLVILATGLGHAPINAVDELTKPHERIYEAIKTLSKRMPVAIAPQTIFGRINMDVYSPGRRLQEAGVLGQGLDMTPETGFIKLAWLLSNYRKEARELYGKNLRGEISERSEENGFPE